MFLPGWRSMWCGITDTCSDHRCLTTCQKQHRQNEPSFWINISTGLEICVIGDPRQVYRPQMSHHLSKMTQTDWTSWSGRHSYFGGGPCDGGSRTLVRTTDVSLPVQNNTDRMNQLFRLTFLLLWKFVWWGIPDTCREHRRLTTCQKQHRQNEPAGQVDIPTRVEVRVKGDSKHV